MRFGNSAKPFEHFIEAVLVILAVVNIAVVALVFSGILKRPMHKHLTLPAPTPSTYTLPQ